MVSWSGSEVQLLLTLVKERESLYDVANEDYTNRDIVWALWTDIARELNKTRKSSLVRNSHGAWVILNL
jgi:hypothetical protein